MAKVLDGNYDNRPASESGKREKPVNRFDNFEQRDHDYDRMVFDDIKRRAGAQEEKK